MHDKQLVDDIPVEKLLVHDVPVDIVCTPTQVIFTNTAIPKPQGWSSFLLLLRIHQNAFDFLYCPNYFQIYIIDGLFTCFVSLSFLFLFFM